LFYCYCAHRYLHSFPTRRSSDLNLIMTEQYSDLRKEPSALYRWMVLVFISLAMFGNYYIYDSIAPVMDLLSSELGYTDQQLGLRSEEHTSELQSRENLVCRLLLE